MNSVSRIKSTRKIILALGDTAILFGSLGVSLAMRDPQLLHLRVFQSFVPLFFLWLTVFYAAGMYEFRLIRDFVSLIRSLLGSFFICAVLASSYFYALSPYLRLTPKTHLFVIVTLAHLGLLFWRRASLRLYRFSLLDLKLALLADADHREYLSGYMAGGVSDWLGLTDVHSVKVDLIVVDGAWIRKNPEEARLAITTALRARVQIVGLDEFYESVFGKVSPSRASDLTWALSHVLPRSGSPYFRMKRLVDVVTAAALLLLFAPVMAIIAVLIRAAEGISPLYGQTRVGYLGQIFTLWKFQSMAPGTDNDGPFAPPLDSNRAQVTRVGRFLRRYRLDELPQLWNVLRGDMSLVGPRPEWIREVEILETAVPTYHLRHLVPPGITGWAQVYFRATHDIQGGIQKHHYDLYYLKNFSLALDFSIMLKTFKRVFVRDARVVEASVPHPSAGPSDTAVGLPVIPIVGRS